MKQLRRLLIYNFILILVLSSCSKNNETKDVQFGVNIEDLKNEIGPDGETISLKITSMGKWVVKTDAPWIHITPVYGEGTSVCTMVIDSTILSGENRKAKIHIISDDELSPKEIDINQKGYDKIIEILEERMISLPGFGDINERDVNVKIKTNVPFSLTASDKNAKWISYELENIQEKLDKGFRPRIINLKVKWSPNSRPEERTLNYYINPVPANTPSVKLDTLFLSQGAAEEFEPTRAGDSLVLLACAKAFNMFPTFNSSEKMHNWDNVTLWEDTDVDVRPEDIGRVKSVKFAGIDIKDEIPYELRYLTALIDLRILTNRNKFLKSLSTGESIGSLPRLKVLQLYSIGINRFESNFIGLGKTLEVLDLSSNNFDDIPSELTPENFPHLKHLDLAGQRRASITNLQATPRPEKEWGGLYKLSTYRLQTLLTWSKLEYLSIQNNYFSFQVPNMLKTSLPKWKNGDTYEYYNYETAKWIKQPIPSILYNTPKVLPNAKVFKMNLNFMYGDLPDWILYHPNLMIWNPLVFIFSHQANGINKNGIPAGFDNVPADPEYYYLYYPEQRIKEYN